MDSTDDDVSTSKLVETEEDDEFEILSDSVKENFFIHKHRWKDNNHEKHKGVFMVHKKYFDKSLEYRNDLSSSSSWSRVYRKLIENDDGKLEELIDMFSQLKDTLELKQKEFADVVVTSIQNIPYFLVHEYSHGTADLLWGGYIKEYHAAGDSCLEKTKFGVQSPVEFMSNFKGDCDTRSMLCYFILKEFGFDVAILVSEVYGHSVLGISGNYSGSYVKYEKTKYYAWETTAMGYSPGLLSFDQSNMDYWYVELSSKK
ncbi:hypothetical protein JYT25_00220 [bacterium AH-315-C20]|nr:hypothetical protein [bacterium AH-315-C20]